LESQTSQLSKQENLCQTGAANSIIALGEQRRIHNELKRQYQLSLSLATIHKILVTNKVKPLRRLKRKEKIRRYSRSIPGERIQMDTCKIAAGIYQYTAVDDCTRYQVMEVYPAHTAANTILFLEKVVEEMRFPV